MTPDTLGPFSRPFPVHRVTPTGVDAVVEASEQERQALAADLGLPSIHRLEGRFRITGTADRLIVQGRVLASLEQVCVVTLEPFPVELDEEVEASFVEPDPRRKRDEAAEIELSAEDDEPDEIQGGRIDLGAITAEFLALALDPYPRRPGVTFEQAEPGADDEGPFARLAALRQKRDDR